ncbi:hypothetical protein [Parabacteroides sp. Marseille-P3160]|nr:hypothetical protein [Parabacteroides sp. Marseille-P3160]
MERPLKASVKCLISSGWRIALFEEMGNIAYRSSSSRQPNG